MADAGAERPLIRLRALGKRWGRRAALVGVDLEVRERAILGVVGPDGAGKTTLLRSLAGLLEVEATEAHVLGHDLRDDTTALKAQVGYVPQVWSLHPHLSVLENLRFTGLLHRLPEAEFRRRADELLARTALAPFADRPAGALSGGMRQKLAVANALLPAPELLLLDEPTAGIDVVARGELWRLLVAAKATALVVMSTSYLDEAAECDVLVYLDEGRVVASGPPAALRARVALECYRAWGDAPRAIAAAARRLPWVSGARAAGRYARVEVPVGRSPGPAAVQRTLADLPRVEVRFAEQIPVDMEAALLALSAGHPA